MVLRKRCESSERNRYSVTRSGDKTERHRRETTSENRQAAADRCALQSRKYKEEEEDLKTPEINTISRHVSVLDRDALSHLQQL
jgi:hypothetical protein